MSFNSKKWWYLKKIDSKSQGQILKKKGAVQITIEKI